MSPMVMVLVVRLDGQIIATSASPFEASSMRESLTCAGALLRASAQLLQTSIAVLCWLSDNHVLCPR